MRLAAQAKSGFYPIAPEVVDLIAARLSPPQGEWCMLDPCAGKGAALKQFASLLNCPSIYGVELDEGRAAEAIANVGGKVLGPCDALSARITSRSFSFVFLNPPFDFLLDGVRAELRFLHKATACLIQDGVLVMILPEHVLSWVESVLRTCYRGVTCLPLPTEHRPFKEVCVFAIRRRHNVDLKESPGIREVNEWDTVSTLDIPCSNGPKSFEKTQLVESEIEAALAASPLDRMFAPPPPTRLARPPLPLGKGHTSLLLASGQLDGVVEKDGKLHVVRGSTRKETYAKDEHETFDAEGNATRVWVEAERMVPLIRTAWPNGEIFTHE